MTLSELKKWAEDLSEKHPQFEEEIRDLYFLAEMEVQHGGSEPHEVELAINDIEELIKQ